MSLKSNKKLGDIFDNNLKNAAKNKNTKSTAAIRRLMPAAPEAASKDNDLPMELSFLLNPSAPVVKPEPEEEQDLKKAKLGMIFFAFFSSFFS